MSITSQWPLPSEGIRFVVPEFIIQELATNPLSMGCYPVAIGYYPAAAGHSMERLNHNENLLIYCTAGSGLVTVAEETAHIGAGDLLILPQGVPHAYQALEKNPWSIYWLHFAGPLSNQFLTPLQKEGEDFRILQVGSGARIVADLETLLDVRRTGYNPRSFIHAANVLRQILSYLALINPQTKTREGLHFDLDMVHAYMQEKLHGQLALEELAARVNLSKYHFSNKYKELTGQSPIQHFLHLKMEHACYLLDISDSSIKEISQNLGYEDNYYFSRLFKKIIGVSPRQYRQLRQG